MALLSTWGLSCLVREVFEGFGSSAIQLSVLEQSIILFFFFFLRRIVNIIAKNPFFFFLRISPVWRIIE